MNIFEGAGDAVLRRIARHAQRAPAALALLAPGRPALSYDALVRQIDYVVAKLAAAGLGQGKRIAVALPDGPEVALLLVAITGCATCAPISIATEERVARTLLERMRIDALVVAQDDDSAVLRAARALGVRLLRVAASPADPAGIFTLETAEASHTALVARGPEPDTIVLLLHTSGSTGAPKIVPLTHRNIIVPMDGRIELLRVTCEDRCLWVTPMHTGAGIRRSLFPTLCSGASIVCAAFGIDIFFACLREFRPTFCCANPAILHALADALAAAPIDAHSLRVLTSGSAPLSSALRQRAEDAFGVPVLQGYGSSEAGSIVHEQLPPALRREGSAGTPVECDIRMLGSDGTPVASEATGEIFVRGPGIFAGYEGDDAANRAAFRDGWFRTGDVGHFDRDGFLFVTGRADEVINRGGAKVSPSEVDAALLQQASIAEAATFPVAHPTLGEDVIAAVVLRAPGSTTASEIRDAAMRSLSGFKVPSRIVIVETIPRMAAGKFNRKHLAEIFAPLLKADHVAPAGTTEQLVAALFADQLGIDRIGANDNFFGLGGDSLSGAKVVARANAALVTDVAPMTLFLQPTVAEFARELERAQAKHGGAQSAAIAASERTS